MLQKLVNEACFTLRITTEGPLLVKSGHASVSGPDMTPVLTWRNGQQQVFLPGSSLKGIFRSHIEKVVCSLKPGVVCYPFKDRPKASEYLDSCGETFNTFVQLRKGNAELLEAHTDRVYAFSCPTCRLFGSTAFIGRVAIGDAYLASDEVKERRDGVGIDRLTGGPKSSALFDMEVVSAGVQFDTNIYLRNFELWQLGMLFVIVQDMEDQLIHIGSGRARGLGKVSAAILEQTPDATPGHPGGLVISSLRTSQKHQEPEHQVWGLGAWLNDGSYGTDPRDFLSLEEDERLNEVKRVDRGIRRQRVFTGQALSALRDQAIGQFVSRMQAWPARPDNFSLD